MTPIKDFSGGRARMFAHRNLRMSRYSTDLSTEQELISRCQTDAPIDPIGVYRVPEIPTEAIVFLRDGLVIVRDQECRRIGYAEIDSVGSDSSEQKMLAERIVLTMRDGRKLTIFVRGGDERTRDVYSVLTFLSRVVKGVK